MSPAKRSDASSAGRLLTNQLAILTWSGCCCRLEKQEPQQWGDVTRCLCLWTSSCTWVSALFPPSSILAVRPLEAGQKTCVLPLEKQNLELVLLYYILPPGDRDDRCVSPLCLSRVSGP